MKTEITALEKKLSDLEGESERARAVTLHWLETSIAEGTETARNRFKRTLAEVIDENYKIANRVERTKAQLSILQQVSNPVMPQQASPVRGTTIKRLRGECKWTIAQLAEIVGVSVRQVQRHEKGDGMHADTLIAYEQVFAGTLKRKIEL